MSSCNFNLPVTGNADDILAKIRESIASNGTLTGDSNAGEFVINTPLGRVEGSYQFAGQQMQILIDRKPMFISCSKIESLIQSRIS